MHTVYASPRYFSTAHRVIRYQSVEGREKGGVVPRRERRLKPAGRSTGTRPWYNARGKSVPEHAAHGVLGRTG
eukprot:2651134-Rhodomonas_salina.1